MSFEIALRLCEVCLAFAIVQRGIEHIKIGDPAIFVVQIAAALALISGLQTPWCLVILWLACAAQLLRFQGAYNGGADKMALLCVTCLLCAHWAPSQQLADVALAYLAVQVVLSYFVSGWVKLRNPSWRAGRALADVFAISAYPVSQDLRGLAARQKLLVIGSWVVILFEVMFPIALLHPVALVFALGLAAVFHLANAMLFGLNRFLWIWLSAFPAVIWFQDKLTHLI